MLNNSINNRIASLKNKKHDQLSSNTSVDHIKNNTTPTNSQLVKQNHNVTMVKDIITQVKKTIRNQVNQQLRKRNKGIIFVIISQELTKIYYTS